MSVVLDIIAVLIVALYTFLGYKKGLIATAISFASSFLCIPLAAFISRKIANGFVYLLISFVVLLVVFKLLFSILGYSLKFIKKIPIIKSVNAVGGSVFGLLNGVIIALILSYVVLGVSQFASSSSAANSLFDNSYVCRYLVFYVGKLFRFLNF